MITKQILRILILIVALTFSSWAQGQSNCVALIQQGLYDTYSQSASSSNYAQMVNNFCGSYSQYLNNQYDSSESNEDSDANSSLNGGSNSVDGSVGFLGFGASGGYSTSNINGQSTSSSNANSESLSTGQIQAIAQFLCTGTNHTLDTSGALQELSSVVDPAVLSAYNDCLAQSQAGLQVSTVQPDQTQVTITLYYLAPVGASGQITLQTVTIAPESAWNCSGSLWNMIQETPSGSNLGNSALGMTCLRTISSKPMSYLGESVYAVPSSITIFTSAGTVQRSFAPIYASPPVSEVDVLKQEISALSAQLASLLSNFTTAQNNVTAQLSVQEEIIDQLQQVTGTNIKETCYDFNLYADADFLTVLSATCQSNSMENITNSLQVLDCSGFTAYLNNQILASAYANDLFGQALFQQSVGNYGNWVPSNLALVGTTLTGTFKCYGCTNWAFSTGEGGVADNSEAELLSDLSDYYFTPQTLSIDLSSFISNHDGYLVCNF